LWLENAEEDPNWEKMPHNARVIPWLEEYRLDHGRERSHHVPAEPSLRSGTTSREGKPTIGDVADLFTLNKKQRHFLTVVGKLFFQMLDHEDSCDMLAAAIKQQMVSNHFDS
jgi:hypothetical protein